MKLSGIVLSVIVGIIMWAATGEVVYFAVGVALGVAFDVTQTKK